MIEEILIRTSTSTNKLRVVVYSEFGDPRPRIYDDPSKSSRLCLEKTMRKYRIRPYLRRDHKITVWIKR